MQMISNHSTNNLLSFKSSNPLNLQRLSMGNGVILRVMVILGAAMVAMAADSDPLQDFCVADIANGLTINGFACKPVNKVTAADFTSNVLTKAGDTKNYNGVAVTPAFVSVFPGLNTLGIAAARLDFAKGGVNPPHTHPRASELVLVVKGTLYAGFVDTNNTLFAATITAGELVVIPRGLVHFQLNVGSGPAVAFAAFDSQNPGVQTIAPALFGTDIDDAVLQKAFRITEDTVNSIQKEFGV